MEAPTPRTVPAAGVRAYLSPQLPWIPHRCLLSAVDFYLLCVPINSLVQKFSLFGAQSGFTHFFK